MTATQRKNAAAASKGESGGGGGVSASASSSDKKNQDNDDKTKKNNGNGNKKDQKPQEQQKPQPVKLSDQLNRAQAAVEGSQNHAFRLHAQWRTHLMRLSYIVIIVTLHQMQTPTSACMKEIKHWNEIKMNSMEEPMSGYAAFWTIVNDSHVEILSVICAGCLAWCLSLPMLNRDFETLPYRMSCAVVPLIVSLYFSHKQNLSSSSTNSCLPSSEKQQYIEDSSTEEVKERPFPIILVFHLIVSISLFFMRFQQKQQEQNVELVRQMRQDLQIAQQSKKKS